MREPDNGETASFRVADEKIGNLLKRLGEKGPLPGLHGESPCTSCGGLCRVHARHRPNDRIV